MAETQEKEPTMVLHEEDHAKELVEVTWGREAKNYQQKLMPREDAIEHLVQFYAGEKIKMVPKNDMNGDPVNTAVCYVKINRRDWRTKKPKEVIKDLPLWIVVDRILNHNYHMELVSKKTYWDFYMARGEKEKKWENDSYDIEKRRLELKYGKLKKEQA